MKLNGLKFFLAAFVGGIVGCAIFMAATILIGVSWTPKPELGYLAASNTPGMDILDEHTCKRGYDKILLVTGVEDGFSREGNEPAEIRPALLDLPGYDDLYHDRTHLVGSRDFDEHGLDSWLITYFDFPPNVESGIFVTRLKFLRGSDTDGISFGDFEEDAKLLSPELGFGVWMPDVKSGSVGKFTGDVISLDLTDFVGPANGVDSNLLEYLRSKKDGVTLDMMIQDDTIVDFAGFALCQKPLESKGTTFRSDSRNLYDSNTIYLSCAEDPYQAKCDPYSGDLLCESEVPLGCYKDGNTPPPTGDNIHAFRFFVGGEIRVTEPVKASRFVALSDATDFCIANFGADWRVLSYHEAGGSAVVARGYIPPKTQMWVDVKDKPLANCWAPLSGSGETGE